MSEFCFGQGQGHLVEAADTIARRHGAALVNHTEPRGERRHWFAGPNRGEPWDSALAMAVGDDLRAAGIWAQSPQEREEVLVHVTRIRDGGVFGHETSHCDTSGCAGDELYWRGVAAEEVEKGGVYSFAETADGYRVTGVVEP